MSSPLPQYYALLHVSPTATTEEIRTAYKKESLRTHPDRNPNATPAEKKKMTEKFQAMADAYYVLSNPQRRREYDVLLRSRGGAKTSFATGTGSTANPETSSGPSFEFPFSSSDPSASSAFFEQFASFFNTAKGTNNASAAPPTPEEEPELKQGPSDEWNDGARPDADYVFGDVFEELMRPEVHKVVNWWTYIGSLSGASLGFILANVPGALAGGLVGNRLGAIRDAKGKPVMVVFAQLGGSQKAEILKMLALKVFGSLTSM